MFVNSGRGIGDGKDNGLIEDRGMNFFVGFVKDDFSRPCKTGKQMMIQIPFIRFKNCCTSRINFNKS